MELDHLTLLKERTAVLANGDRVPLIDAALAYRSLQTVFAMEGVAGGAERNTLYHLRAICLGRTIGAESQRILIENQLLRPDGSTDPVVKAIVLSAVTGVEQELHLRSPFTDRLDRALSEYVTSRDFIRCFAEGPGVDTLLNDDPIEAGLSGISKWPREMGNPKAFAQRVSRTVPSPDSRSQSEKPSGPTI